MVKKSHKSGRSVRNRHPRPASIAAEVPSEEKEDYWLYASAPQLLDRMGKVELAANLFRVTQTDERIKNQNLQGQRLLENAAENVGRDVRKLMMKTSGRKPEDLRLAAPIKDVKRAITP